MAGHNWLDAVGRLAFPIFAFLTAEGFFHTRDFKKYLARMFLFALASELPFDLIAEGGWFYPFHQNVLFTFCIALPLMAWMERPGEAPDRVFSCGPRDPSWWVFCWGLSPWWTTSATAF